MTPDEYYRKLVESQYRPKIQRQYALIADLMDALSGAYGAEHPDGMPAVLDEEYAALVARCRALGIEAGGIK